ncbi:hypothetical protein GCM10011511_40010 [Puia dinghuensis]|uniref:DUF3999 family protein n=2 Tax=Puia dinghuensis TaxID=1792502 RepID=A0A8J2XSV2_9BACT|nr:hypothetical protein GCM10011511_40010 [Puia dinghuensis]
MIFVFSGAGAQGIFTCRAALDTIRKDGFYRIVLTPQVVAKSRVDLADVRIQSLTDKRFVSYELIDRWTTPDSQEQWLELPRAEITQKDSSNKHSYITLQYAEAYEVDRLAFLIQSPVFYKREAHVALEGGTPGEWAPFVDITLAPGKKTFDIPVVKRRRLRIDIANADNSPLVIREITGFQAAHYLVAYLQAGLAYQLLTGNAEAVTPNYDLKSFTDSLTAAPPMILPGRVEKTAVAASQPIAPAAKAGDQPSGNRQGLLLWGILFAILILLVYFSVRMVKAITQKERHDRV